MPETSTAAAVVIRILRITILFQVAQNARQSTDYRRGNLNFRLAKSSVRLSKVSMIASIVRRVASLDRRTNVERNGQTLALRERHRSVPHPRREQHQVARLRLDLAARLERHAELLLRLAERKPAGVLRLA